MGHETAGRDDQPATPFLRLMARAHALGGVELERPPREYESRVDVDGVIDVVERRDRVDS